MGAIEDIYADLDVDVSEAEFREAVEAKVEQMDGLADEETAAMLIAHELEDHEVGTISDIEPGMDEVKFLAKVVSVGELRTFERDGEDEDGRVINVEAADESGTVRLAFWDEQAASIDDGQLDVGDVLRVKGRPKDGYNGLEVSVDKAEPDDEADIDVDLDGPATVESLSMGQSDVNLRGLVLDTDDVRTFDRDDGSEGRVANFALGDETGRVRVTLWDEMADRATELAAGTAVEVVDGYVREREGDLELHVGDGGAVEEVDGEVSYDPDTTPIGDVEIDQTVDIAGVVRSTDPKRTFDRDDGSEGQVRNVRIQDDTGDIRVALWGDKADTDLAPGDEVLTADVQIEDGWQDDLEASANWRSTVLVLDDADTGTSIPAGGADEAASEDSQSAGLDAFSEGSDATDAGDTGGTADAAGSEGGTVASERVEFTGTVVQTGDPVVLDDGTETMAVETDAHVRLGEEITARGQVVDGRLDAEDVL
ncbi:MULTISPECIES: single-stranded DNA binding protein [Salinibaculum]|uniref:single-stranded DNA binding protein n=1 Tax=Salinibaculum TaxID=2732368 RepID=UPI0030D4C38B